MTRLKITRRIIAIILLTLFILTIQGMANSDEVFGNRSLPISTFSIVAYDSLTGELGIAVASRFFAVGSVVPWAKADVGAIATQSYANTSFGWQGLELLEDGMAPDEVLQKLLSGDNNPSQRQVGIVASNGRSATYTGEDCLAWAGGRSGVNYAIQGNILAGEEVITAMEKAFLEKDGTLADRIYYALVAGEENGGDSRGKQSAAILIVKEGAGYGGYTDRAIDIRVDDHTEPFKELGRLLNIAQMNYSWNEAWTLFTEKKFKQALPHMERAALLSPDYPELVYDLAVIRLALDDKKGAMKALKKALKLNPKLVKLASEDKDLSVLKGNVEFDNLIKSVSKNQDK